MKKYYALKHIDNSIEIMETAVDPEICLAKWHPTNRAKIISWREVALSDIPNNREFRPAWVDSGLAIVEDMPRSRECHREKMRLVRLWKFEPFERAQRTALVNSDMVEAQRLEAKLQELSDVTADPRIEAAATPDELKLVWPECLK